jgi:hypothetical protein
VFYDIAMIIQLLHRAIQFTTRGDGISHFCGRERTDPAPNLWRSEICGYTIPEGGKGSCKRFKRPIQQSLSVKQSNCPDQWKADLPNDSYWLLGCHLILLTTNKTHQNGGQERMRKQESNCTSHGTICGAAG